MKYLLLVIALLGIVFFVINSQSSFMAGAEDPYYIEMRLDIEKSDVQKAAWVEAGLSGTARVNRGASLFGLVGSTLCYASFRALTGLIQRCQKEDKV